MIISLSPVVDVVCCVIINNILVCNERLLPCGIVLKNSFHNNYYFRTSSLYSLSFFPLPHSFNLLPKNNTRAREWEGESERKKNRKWLKISEQNFFLVLFLWIYVGNILKENFHTNSNLAERERVNLNFWSWKRRAREKINRM